MIVELLRNELEKSEKSPVSRAQISREIGIPEYILSRFYKKKTESISVENAEKLLNYFGYRLVKGKTRRKS